MSTGYDSMIYAADDLKYSEDVAVTIDAASVADNKVTVQFSAVESPHLDGVDVADIAPTVLVGMCGWDTKDFVTGAHERLIDDNGNGEISRAGGDERALEYEVGAEHSRAETVSAADGSWEVVIDMSTRADLIDDGTVERLEIAVVPTLENADGKVVSLDAPSRTFDLGSNDFDDDFYSPIAKVGDGCENCHDALATNYHSPGRGGNIGEVSSTITGPAARACGGCHAAEMINEDEAGEPLSWSQRIKQGGYLIEGDANNQKSQDNLLMAIDEIMANFE